MVQFLHVFKKDIHRHWPEIFISLALLAAYARSETDFSRTWSEYNSISPFSLFPFLRSGLPLFLILSWIFLILRVVQSEALVGDRQWWVTKPYIWWQLLFSKLFFIFVVIWVPLFQVQLFLLHRIGFSIFPNLGRLFLMQLTLPLLLFAFAFALAALTRNLAQALLGIGIVVVIFIIGSWLDSLSSHMKADSPHFLESLESVLILGSMALVPVWQFARRRTWASRIAILAGFAAVTVFSLIPFGSRVEQSYPLLAANDFPARLTIPTISESQGNPSSLTGFTPEAVLTIPVNVSDVPSGSVVLIDGIKITVDSASDSHWTRGWVSQYGQLWPGSQRQNVTYAIKRKDYERVKAGTLDLHMELALSEYQEVGARALIVPAATFRDSDLGICRLVGIGYQVLECRRPFHSPAYMGRFDAPNSPCGSESRFPDDRRTNLDVAYAWAPPSDEVLVDPGLNPVVEYPVTFSPTPRIPAVGTPSRIEYGMVTLCPDAEIRLARPVFKRHFRVPFQLSGVRLQDLVERSSF